MITAHGVFKESLSFFHFVNSLRDSELSQPQHHLEPMTADYLGRDIQVKLCFADHVDFLVDSSFDDGLLSPWKEKFSINKGLSAVVEKYSKQV